MDGDGNFPGDYDKTHLTADELAAGMMTGRAQTDFYGRIARATVNLDRFVMHQDRNEHKFADVLREYGPRVRIDRAPDLATAVLYSECDQSAAWIAAKYELTAIDGYLLDPS